MGRFCTELLLKPYEKQIDFQVNSIANAGPKCEDSCLIGAKEQGRGVRQQLLFLD